MRLAVVDSAEAVSPVDVLRPSHGLEVSGVHAQPISAEMIEFEARGYTLAGDLGVGKMCGSNGFTFGETEITIAVMAFRPAPEPTARRERDVAEKPFPRGHSKFVQAT